MSWYNNGQLVGVLMNLNQCFTNLYDLKFQGKKIMEEINNCSWEKQILTNSIKKQCSQGESIIYLSAIASCSTVIGSKLSEFQEFFLKKYMINVEVSLKNKDYLLSIEQRNADGCVGAYEVLVSQLVEIGVEIARQYEQQLQLILKHWQKITSKCLINGLESDEGKQLMLHIGFESEIESQQRQIWKNKLFAYSNQKYNPRKS